MNPRKRTSRRLATAGFVSLAILGIGLTATISFKSLSKTSGSPTVLPQSGQDAALSDGETNNGLLQTHHDSTTVRDILSRSELLETMDQWNGKVLFAKLDETQSPPQFRYYYHDSIYQDSNHNSLQDPEDAGFFNPASTVKISLVALALETLADMELPRQAEYREVGTERWYQFENDMRRALVISDNDATNRLILWLGFDEINRLFVDKGFSHLAINRLMLDRGTLVPSPSFEMRFNGQTTQRAESPVTTELSCYETRKKVGNCASANDLLQGLMQINHPEYFLPDEGFLLLSEDRTWFQSTMSHTPREEGFDYADDYCRFLSTTESQLADDGGAIMLSKCGVSLFTNTYTDLSYIETDAGQKYYFLLSLSPPRSVAEPQIIHYMNQVAGAILSVPL